MASPRHVTPTARPTRPAEPATVDLHSHTTRSDGLLEPAELLRQALAAGVRTLAITDHDSVAAYREVAALSLPPGTVLIPGVEINAIGGGLGIETHILGLGVDPSDETFEAALAAQRAERRRRFDRIVSRLRELDLPIDAETEAIGDSGDDALGRPTVARALVRAGHATTVDDAFERLLSWGRPAYVPRDGLGPVEAIRAIRAAGGLPSLAHDHLAADHVVRLRDFRDVGLGGLEVFHRSFDAVTRERVGSVASNLRLVRTGGTDYHGDVGPYADSLAELVIDPAVGGEVMTALGGAIGVPSSGP